MLTEMHSFSLECALFFISQEKKINLEDLSCVENELLAFVKSPPLFYSGAFVERFFGLHFFCFTFT